MKEERPAEEAVSKVAATRAERNSKKVKKEKKKKMKPFVKVLLVLLILIILAAGAVGVATYTHYLVWMEEGPMISDKEDLTMQLNAEDLEQLGYFKDLKHVDLTGSPAGFEAVKAWAEAHPNVDVDYMVDLPEGATFDVTTGEVDFTKVSASVALDNIDLAQQILKGKSVKIDPQKWTIENVAAFLKKLTRYDYKGSKRFIKDSADYIDRYMKLAPELEYSGTLAIENYEVSIFDTTLNFSEGLSDAGFLELEDVLKIRPMYTEIDFGSEEAHDHLDRIYNFYKKHPEITVHYEFGVLGQRHDILDTILDFRRIRMYDQGAEVRSVIQYMPHLRILDMDMCNVDHEHMVGIYNDYPDVLVVWRLWFPNNEYYALRTDAEKIFLSAFGGGMLEASDCQQLRYCNKVKYMDIGHNEELDDASFLAYMPELEVCVLSINKISDISGLSNCPHLEYLEMFNTHITNLDAIAGCTELKHLNVCQNPYLTDIQGTYGLSGLERFWVGDYYSTSVPRAQVAKFKELNPDTLTCDYTYGAHTAGWRTGPRYELLWNQMGYGVEDSDYSYYWTDPLFNPRTPSKYTEANGYTAENGYWNKYPMGE